MKSKVFQIIRKERRRQRNDVELIASENFVSRNIRRAVGSCLTNKYTEGYPGNRYYGGCQYYDELEQYCQDQWRAVFCTNYHVNVQPHSGSQANCAAYAAVLRPGDTVLSMALDNGGHLTHGSSVNFSGKTYNFVHYGLTADGLIDYEDLYEKIEQHKPRLVVAGASAYPREIDFCSISRIINLYNSEHQDATRVLFMVDMAHIAGLVATGLHQSPFGFADIITTTTHKTLRAARGGLIFCKPELAKKVDSAIFPGTQGGSLMHVIAGKAIGAEEALTPAYHQYMRRVVQNTKAMADVFTKRGFDVVTGGTDNHLFLLDFSKTHPHISGKDVQDALGNIHITVNKNCVPGETRSPRETSGIRIGCAAMTTKGWKEKRFIKTAHKIADTINLLELGQRIGTSL